MCSRIKARDVFCPDEDSSLQTVAEAVQLQCWRAAIRTVLTTEERKRNSRALSLQRGYLKGVKEWCLKRFKGPRGHNSLWTQMQHHIFLPSLTTLPLHTELVAVPHFVKRLFSSSPCCRNLSVWLQGQHKTISAELVRNVSQDLGNICMYVCNTFIFHD